MCTETSVSGENLKISIDEEHLIPAQQADQPASVTRTCVLLSKSMAPDLFGATDLFNVS